MIQGIGPGIYILIVTLWVRYRYRAPSERELATLDEK